MILVTGGTGFVGLAILKRLAKESQHDIRATVRRSEVVLPPGVGKLDVADLAPDTDWAIALNGVEVVVHASARVHVMQEAAADPLAEFRRVNVQGTLNLVRQAATAGVRRFVFISSERRKTFQPFLAHSLVIAFKFFFFGGGADLFFYLRRFYNNETPRLKICPRRSCAGGQNCFFNNLKRNILVRKFAHSSAPIEQTKQFVSSFVLFFYWKTLKLKQSKFWLRKLFGHFDLSTTTKLV